MKRFLVATLLVSASVLAAPGGKPPPQTPAQRPLMMVDLSGKELGPAIPADNGDSFGQVASVVQTYVRYGGETFAVPFDQGVDLAGNAGLTRYFAPHPGTLYFAGPGCTGATYINPLEHLQVTPRVAMVVYATREEGGVPRARYLYATEPHNVRGELLDDYASRLFNGACDPNPGHSGFLIPATLVVDLTAAFPPPYEVK